MSNALRKTKRRLNVLERQLDRNLESRPCGECSACCTVLGVEELNKPMDTPCKHLGSIGCSIYPERPESCRTFVCLWRAGIGTLEERPDKSGIVLDAARQEAVGERALVAREVYPGAFVEAYAFLKELAHRHLIFLVSGDRPRRVMGPEDRVLRARDVIEAMKRANAGV